MTNYGKLCEAVGIEHAYTICKDFRQCEITPCDNCVNNLKVYPTFTAKKQIKLIELIAGRRINHPKERVQIACSENQIRVCTATRNLKDYTDFSKAIAGLALQLIEAGELDKDEVRRILE